MANNPNAPVRLPLAAEVGTRDGTSSKDARLINCYVEVVDGKVVKAFKRPGLVVQPGGMVPTQTLRTEGFPVDQNFQTEGLSPDQEIETEETDLSPVGRGIFLWQGSVYEVLGHGFYKDRTLVALTDAGSDLSMYTFSSCLGAVPKLFLKTGSAARAYDATNGLVPVVDANYPVNTVPGAVYLDGTMYVMTPLAEIRGSGLNDLLTWDPLNSILAQIEPDAGVCIAKQLVYVIAFKQWSTEMFYDAGNAQGSPLAPVQGAKLQIGCAAAHSVQDVDGSLHWVAQTRNGGLSVQRMTAMKAEKISTPVIDRILEKLTAVYDVTSWAASIAGHPLYLLSFGQDNLTLVYDGAVHLWYIWTDAEGNRLDISQATIRADGKILLQGASDGNTYVLGQDQTTDNGALIPVDIYVPNFDAGSKNKKYLRFLEIVGDLEPGSFLDVRVSDDDYQTWSQFRRIDLSVPRARLSKLGTFYRRAFHFHHACPTRLRLEGVELQLEIGDI